MNFYITFISTICWFHLTVEKIYRFDNGVEKRPEISPIQKIIVLNGFHRRSVINNIYNIHTR